MDQQFQFRKASLGKLPRTAVRWLRGCPGATTFWSTLHKVNIVMRKVLIPMMVVGAVGLSTFATAQSKVIYLSSTTSSQALTANPQAKPLTVGDVIKLSRVGLSDDVIIQQIKKKGPCFDLSTDQLIQLKSASVSERVIKAMLDPTSAATPAAEVKTAAPAASASAAQQPELEVNRPPSPTVDLPTEIGVYAKEKGKWTEVLPEVVNWKTGGAIKSVASAGIVKGDVNGHVNGASSRNRITTPSELLIVLPEGTAITEYQLLKLHQHGGDREFRTVTGGVFHVSGGATRDLMSFEPTKVAARTYTVSLSSGPGEYGFLPPGAFTSMNAASAGKIYSFRIND